MTNSDGSGGRLLDIRRDWKEVIFAWTTNRNLTVGDKNDTSCESRKQSKEKKGFGILKKKKKNSADENEE